ncbi:MAG: FAD-linked oxidase C-terminal domain-containing protein [Candidatus Eremiobacteraeota bacterium]|nr:FAD-linked oxidase C-terminal domain-containing protein [Candidatus Eremiobacteraeota bacterium]
MAGFNSIDSSVRERLKAIVGEKHVIFGSPADLEPYSHDEIPEKCYAHSPECVVKPGSAGEVASIMKLACECSFPVTPRGAGSGLSGGAVPIHGGLVMLFDRMNRVVDYDKDNMTITVEPGIVTNEINTYIKGDGLFYAGYPMSYESCSIGGNVAENAGGAKAIKYGVTGRYVTGLEIVTPAGELVSLGGKLVKDVTGYDLLHLLVGSEGTLAIFTKITLKLLPLPKEQIDLIAPFGSVEEAIGAVPRLMTSTGIIPSSIEFMDRLSVETACSFLGETIPGLGSEAVLLISVDGADPEELMKQCEALGECCMESGASDVFVADSRQKSENLWKVRRDITEALKARSPHMSTEDIVVPVARIPEAVAGLKALAEKHDIQIPCFGHAGDGNLHATPLMNPRWSSEEWLERLGGILRDIYDLTKSLGGVISGEHGIGHKRKGYLSMFCTPAHLELMRGIKKVFDPQGILNPGKILE